MVNLVVTCTATKSAPAEVEWNGQDVATWWGLIKEAPARHQIVDLYSGPSWAASRRLADSMPRASIHVISAGLGLVSINEHAPSYDATFTPGGSTDIAGRTTGSDRRQLLRSWWDRSCIERGRSLESLAEDGAPLLVVASGHYLDAIERDMQAAIDVAADRAVIVGVDVHQRYPWLNGSMPTFGQNVLKKTKLTDQPSSQINSKRLGGGTATLGQVVARDLIRRTDGEVSAKRMSEAADDLMHGIPPRASHERDQLEDGAVLAWMEEHYDPKARGRGAHTPLLRLLREQGWACEQGRFRSLFHLYLASLSDEDDAE